MTPVLFPADALTFETQGLGALSDCASAEVTEERNGTYELTLTYPVAGIRYEEIAVDRIIMAIPSPFRRAQPFRIYKVTRPLGGLVTVYARHISYDLSGIPVNPFTAGNIQDAFAGLKSNEAVASNFSYETNRTTAVAFSVHTPSSARSLLGGVEGSILDVYGGEYEFDGWTVRNSNARGANRGVTIRYGKNLTACQLEQDSSNSYAGVLAYWYQEETGERVSAPIVYAPGHSGAPVFVLDCSEQYETAPTVEQLKQRAAAYIANNNLADLKLSLEASFVHLEQMEGYEDIAPLERCDLCDTVTVQYPTLGVDVTAKIVSITTDVLQERYKTVTIGSIAANIAATIADQQAAVEQSASKTYMQRAIATATDWLTNGQGYKIERRDANGNTVDTLYMDTPDIASARNVLRIGQSGIGFSRSGVNGPYVSAWTLDGTLNMSNINVVNLVADMIRGGTLTLGGQDDVYGVMRVLDADGNQIGYWGRSGISINGGQIQTASSMTIDGTAYDATGGISGGFMRSVSNDLGLRITTSPVGLSLAIPNSAAENGVESWRPIAQIGLISYTAAQKTAQFLLYSPVVGANTAYISGETGNANFLGTVTQGSDRRLKSNIRDVPEGLIDAFLALTPRLYTLIASGKNCAGLVAQEVQGTPLEDILVVRSPDTDLLMLDYTSLHALELAAIQRQETRLRRLEELYGG